MNGKDFISLLGMTIDEAPVQRMLAEYGIAKKPKRSQYSFDAYLSNEKKGLDVTFTDEQDIKIKPKGREYDEGDLVLSNVRMYGLDSTQGYATFPGEFPHDLAVRLGLKEVEARLGKAADGNKGVAMMRWDFKDHALFINFDKNFTLIRSAAVQLPVPVRKKKR